VILNILGLTLPGIIVVSVALWIVQLLSLRASARIETALALELLRQEFAAAARVRAAQEVEQPAWLGYRNFLVERKIKDGPSSDSFCLIPQDGRPLPDFRPGQSITVRVRLYGQDLDQKESIERRYPITSQPNEHFYCISVDRAPDVILSGCLHEGIAAGTVVDVLAPRGELCLTEQRHRPVVLVADGVGIEPCISMLETAAQSHPDRAVTVIYGVRNGRDHGIEERLQQLAKRFRNLRFSAVESHANAEDLVDSCRFDFAGSISIDALKNALPSNNFDFQLWGPSFMVETMKQALTDWGVPERRVRTETFGAPLAPVIAAINGEELPRPIMVTAARTLTWKPTVRVAEEAWPVEHTRVLKNPAYRSTSHDVTRRIQRRRAPAAIG
jgi:ferredoxin-NADP reductase